MYRNFRLTRTRKRTRASSGSSYGGSSYGDAPIIPNNPRLSEYNQPVGQPYPDINRAQPAQPLPLPAVLPPTHAERTTEHNRRQNMKKMFKIVSFAYIVFV